MQTLYFLVLKKLFSSSPSFSASPGSVSDMRRRNEGGRVVTHGTMRSEKPALADMACTAHEPLPGPPKQTHTHTHTLTYLHTGTVFQQLVHNLLNATKLHYCVLRCVRSPNMQLLHGPRPLAHPSALGFLSWHPPSSLQLTLHVSRRISFSP